VDVALRDAIQAGDVPGPRMLVSGPALGITGGHCDSNLLAPEFHYFSQGVADGPWAARAKVRENIKYGADLIKICASGGVMSKGDQPGTPQYSLEEMQAIVDEAHKLGHKVAAHAHGAQSIKDAIRAGEGAKVGMLPESIEKERKIGRLQRENFRKAMLGGAKLAFGTDAGVYPDGGNWRQFAYCDDRCGGDPLHDVARLQMVVRNDSGK
jgi:imidazolonepropionase-like amidohydrolase